MAAAAAAAAAAGLPPTGQIARSGKSSEGWETYQIFTAGC